MDRNRGFIEIGQIIRSHGLEGILKVRFENVDVDVLHTLSLIYLQNNRGDLFPVRLENIEADLKTPHLFFVQFESISDRSEADRLRNKSIFVEEGLAAELLDEPESEFDDLIDCEVIDENDQSVGLVSDVMDNPAHPILLVSTTQGSLMIPFVEHYIQSVEDKTINCINLDELTDL